MKKFYIFLILLSSALSCLAAPIDKNRARKIAEEFYKQQAEKDADYSRKRSTKTTKFQLDYICKNDSQENKRAKASKQAADNLYYVFNADNERGFVIVSGDDKAGEVLAYADSGNFSHSDMPDNLKYWMESYKDAIKAIVNNEIEIDQSSAENTPDSFAKEILPLLKKEGIKWDQTTPFNKLCPIDSLGKRSVTGCVATAMSQVMRYHKHPQKGKGEKTYSYKGAKEKINVNFANATYDWDNILTQYTEGKYNEKQSDAIALLSYHVGVSVEMQYSSRASGAITAKAQKALVEHFSYDKKINFLKREHYSNEEWQSTLKKELNEKRPVIYNGQSKRGGHAFVCDGYDSNNLYHINWGWSGISNGYFDLTILEPQSQGTGGGSGGYSWRQGMIIGIEPEIENATSNWNYIFSFENATLPDSLKFDRKAPFDIVFKNLINESGANYEKGELRLVMKSEDAKLYVLKSIKDFKLRERHLYENYPLTKVKVPANAPKGKYELLLQIQDPARKSYTTVLTKDESYRNIKIELGDNLIEFKYKKLNPKLELIGEATIENKNFYLEKNGNISLKLKNSGNATFRSKIGVALRQKSGTERTILDSLKLGIEINETRSFSFKKKIDLAPGDYVLEILYANNANEALNTPLGNGKEVKILPALKPAQFQCENLKYNRKISVGDKLQISFETQNEGDFMLEEFKIYLYKRDEENFKYFKIINKQIAIDKAETKTIYFEIDTEGLEDSKSIAKSLQMKNDAPYVFLIIHNNKKLKFDEEEQFYFYIYPQIARKNSILSCNPSTTEELVISKEELVIDLAIENSGDSYKNNTIRVEFLDQQGKPRASIEKNYTIEEKLSIRIEDTKETKELLPGTYTLKILYKNEKNEFTAMEGEYRKLKIVIVAPELSIGTSTNDMTTLSELKFKLTETFKYDVKIKNSGGAFNEELYLDIIPSEQPSKEGQKIITLMANMNVARESTEVASFTEKLEKLKYKAGSYTIQVKQKKATTAIKSGRNQESFINIGDPIKFTLLHADGSLANLPKDEEIPSKESEISTMGIKQQEEKLEIIFPQNSETLYIYDMTGQLISKNKLSADQTEFMYNTSKLNRGIYLVVAEGVYGKIVEKVILK